ncbi:Crp/Fnr family transcriptional regulator [Ramlibacter sp. RBP-2]|uniref:Crp/Fnr family transcriptional regulator n=1 Tax=Ramlibacter lithotrophicus TaxID=2606681 RepID=A0A7X6DGQ1_9BURK|nr:Crp/Fnr family transcriptional regulator [Ramlibacter lithotrophicus]NKE66839.1 Crp/Fnr family transcriptional regulator [Ramlibacter lithotrophicus]
MAMQQFGYTDVAKLLISDVGLPELSPAQALRLAQLMKLTTAEPESVLFRPGGPGLDFMIMLLAGDAVIEGQLTGADDWIVLRGLVPGSLFGELGALDSIARAVVVRATSDVCIATLDDAALGQLTQNDPALAFVLLRALLAYVTRRLRSAHHRIGMLHEINLAQRQELASEIRSDEETRARLRVVLKLESKFAMRTGGDVSRKEL